MTDAITSEGFGLHTNEATSDRHVRLYFFEYFRDVQVFFYGGPVGKIPDELIMLKRGWPPVDIPG